MHRFLALGIRIARVLAFPMRREGGQLHVHPLAATGYGRYPSRPRQRRITRRHRPSDRITPRRVGEN